MQVISRKGRCLNTGRTWFPKGHVPAIKGQKHTEETRAKMRARWVERHRRGEQVWNKGLCADSDGRVRQYGLRQRGKQFSKETIDKMSVAKKGKRVWRRSGRTTNGDYPIVLDRSGSEIGRYRREHRLIAEKAIGRKLKKDEVVHHVNGNKADNRNCNLLICDKSYHMWLHQRMSQLYMKEHFAEV